MSAILPSSTLRKIHTYLNDGPNLQTALGNTQWEMMVKSD